MAAPGSPADAYSGSREPLAGLPTHVTIPGVGKVEAGPNLAIRELAEKYAQSAGLAYNPPTDYVKADPERGARIAAEFDKMKDDPHDPHVAAAYNAMIHETTAQYKALMDAGLKVEFINYAKQGDPYAASPRLAIQDINQNSHMWVFATKDGFGTDTKFDASRNPLLRDTSFQISGQTATANDLFRVVHDVFGHAKEGIGMRADGEENAWRSHVAMYSPLAAQAMTTETRGQNSWVNFGPYAEHNRTAKGSDTHYADQKVGLLPSWTATEGARTPRSHSELLEFAGPEDEARDEHGRWTTGGGGEGGHPEPPGTGHAAERSMLTMLKATNGFSYAPAADRFQMIGSTGYAVSPYESREATFDRPVSKADLHSFMARNADLLAKPDHYVGGWRDTVSGKVFLDVSIIVGDRGHAESIAAQYHQLGIFDFRTGDTIDTSGASHRAHSERDGRGDGPLPRHRQWLGLFG